MRKLLLLFFLIICICLEAQVNPNYHKVRGYYRKDGTYVRPHYRTNPNHTNRDNYSTLGNTNPWTLKPGWIPPDNKPLPKYRSSSSMPRYEQQTRSKTTYSTFGYASDEFNTSSGGQRTIQYLNGKEVFSVLPKINHRLDPAKTYFSFDPYTDEIKQEEGRASGQLLDGAYRFVDDNGVLRRKEKYKKGLRDGLFTLYNERGKRTQEIQYREGIITFLEYIDAEGDKVQWHGTPDKVGSTKKIFKGDFVIEETKKIGEEKYLSTIYSLKTKKRELNYMVEGERLHGPYSVYYEDGHTPKITGTFTEGVKTGETKEYYANGKLQGRYSLVGEAMDGPFTFYHENGLKRVQGRMKRGEYDGEVRWYATDGTLESIETFSNGTAHGLTRDYHAGKLVFQGRYLEGKKHGSWNYYYHQEEPPRQYTYQYFTYDRDVLHGPFRSFTGDSLMVGNYHRGALHGEIEIYRPVMSMIIGAPPDELRADQLIAEGRYSYGKKDGMWIEYSLPRKVQTKGLYQSGGKSGEWRYYYPWVLDEQRRPKPYAGKLYRIENYLAGRLHGVSTRYSYLEKEEIPCAVEGVDSCFDHKLVKVLEKSTYRNGVLHGPSEVYDSTEKLVRKGMYANGKRDGIWTEHTSTGRIEVGITNGQLSGIYRRYDLKERLVESGEHDRDRRSGVWYTYVPGKKGKLQSMTFYESNSRRTILYRYDQTPEFEFMYQDDELEQMLVYEDNGLDTLVKIEVVEKLDTRCRLWQEVYLKDKLEETEIQVLTDQPKILDSPLLILGQLGWDNRIRRLEHIKVFKHGDYILSHRNSVEELIVGQFEKGKKSGLWKRYLNEHGITQQIAYTNGDIVGETFIDQRTGRGAGGKVSWVNEEEALETVSIKKGVRHGRTIVSSLDGVTKQVSKYRKGSLIK